MPFFFSLAEGRLVLPKEGNPNPVLRDKTSDTFHVEVHMQNLFGCNWQSQTNPYSPFYCGCNLPNCCSYHFKATAKYIPVGIHILV